ncbi:MAG: hypothetical protein K6U80_17850 [Firmicutes bacterium]|nr:hypothetical protein [Bacillota bacterium]
MKETMENNVINQNQETQDNTEWKLTLKEVKFAGCLVNANTIAHLK